MGILFPEDLGMCSMYSRHLGDLICLGKHFLPIEDLLYPEFLDESVYVQKNKRGMLFLEVLSESFPEVLNL